MAHKTRWRTESRYGYSNRYDYLHDGLRVTKKSVPFDDAMPCHDGVLHIVLCRWLHHRIDMSRSKFYELIVHLTLLLIPYSDMDLSLFKSELSKPGGDCLQTAADDRRKG